MNTTKTLALGLLGAALGGTAGYFLFGWLLQQGFYALLLPPASVGFGAGLAARQRCIPLAAVSAVLGLALGVFTQWRFAPFTTDESLGYFLAHLHQLRPMTLIFLLIGGVLAYRLALGREATRRPGEG